MKNKNKIKINENNLKTLVDDNLQFLLSFKALSQQNMIILSKILIDFQQWNIANITIKKQQWLQNLNQNNQKQIFSIIKTFYDNLLKNRKYSKTQKIKFMQPKKVKKQLKQQGEIFGFCPVYSDKTLCCNLYTIDAVQGCGFGCSYCSILSFYQEDEVNFVENLSQKLKNIELDKNKKYHIGSGQSSDSLLWGNKLNVLDDLLEFARLHPDNIVLELKTKSANIKYFLKTPIPMPKNVIISWSLNPQIIIDNEEHLCASLDDRLKSALALAQKGIKIGFHLHPIIHFKDYEKHYKNMIQKIMNIFKAEQIRFISFGSLTFSKQAIKEIRKTEQKTKILQMPMNKTHQKYSYPYETKKGIFKNIYSYFKPWHNRIFFYFCMEDKKLWDDIFAFSFADNKQFSNKLFSVIMDDF
ncbi:MAG: hypothetical protein DRQ51_08340 [Gammaproteobacteria bacterium]|nr:MAG: hypothetical protein DRQ51_08340 [Gammaproteobacteria bacterium]